MNVAQNSTYSLEGKTSIDYSSHSRDESSCSVLLVTSLVVKEEITRVLSIATVRSLGPCRNSRMLARAFNSFGAAAPCPLDAASLAFPMRHFVNVSESVFRSEKGFCLSFFYSCDAFKDNRFIRMYSKSMLL